MNSKIATMADNPVRFIFHSFHESAETPAITEFPRTMHTGQVLTLISQNSHSWMSDAIDYTPFGIRPGLQVEFVIRVGQSAGRTYHGMMPEEYFRIAAPFYDADCAALG